MDFHKDQIPKKLKIPVDFHKATQTRTSTFHDIKVANSLSHDMFKLICGQ